MYYFQPSLLSPFSFYFIFNLILQSSKIFKLLNNTKESSLYCYHRCFMNKCRTTFHIFFVCPLYVKSWCAHYMWRADVRSMKCEWYKWILAASADTLILLINLFIHSFIHNTFYPFSYIFLLSSFSLPFPSSHFPFILSSCSLISFAFISFVILSLFSFHPFNLSTFPASFLNSFLSSFHSFFLPSFLPFFLSSFLSSFLFVLYHSFLPSFFHFSFLSSIPYLSFPRTACWFVFGK